MMVVNIVVTSSLGVQMKQRQDGKNVIFKRIENDIVGR